MRRKPSPLALLLAACSFLSQASAAHAAWTTNTAVNVPICQAYDVQQFTSPNGQSLVADGSGGFFAVWVDARFSIGFGAQGYDVYGQHFNSQGNALWPSDGALLAGGTTNQMEPSAVTDGAGGILVTWTDYRTSPQHIWAQRFNASGVAQWTAGGVSICSAAGGQSGPMLASDGAGGAYIVWNDYRNTATTGNDIYAQRVSSNGTVQWTVDGVPVCNAPAAQSMLSFATDPSGGFWALWSDQRNSASTNSDLYMNRILSNGGAWWNTSQGYSVCSATGYQYDGRVIVDGLGGAYFVWTDARTPAPQIQAQHFGPQTTPTWPTDGITLTSLVSTLYVPTSRPVSDGAGGLIVAYASPPVGAKVTRLLPNAARAWAADVALAPSTMTAGNLWVGADGRGGLEALWDDPSIPNGHIRGQRIDVSGALSWPAGGAVLCAAYGFQSTPYAVSDGAQGLFVAWTDGRNGSANDLFGGHVDRAGHFGGAEPSIQAIRDVPNDQGGSVRLSLNASYLDQPSLNRISTYSVWRQAPAALAARALRESATTGASRYRVTRDGANVYYWEYVTNLGPHGFDGYSAVLPTTGDSTAYGNPRTAFMVEAMDSQNYYYDSLPDSGYSVDNLPPAAPAPFTGQFAANQTKLHWNRNTEADLAGYRLYRGLTAAFATGAGSLVSALPDTGYTDATTQPYFYKLSAVDGHGNESPVASLTPQGVLGVDDSGARHPLALARPAPSPALGATRLAFTLAAPGEVTLALYDASGRRVRGVVRGALAAGEHAFAIALTDDAGHALAAGLYFARLTTGAATLTQRLVILHD